MSDITFRGAVVAAIPAVVVSLGTVALLHAMGAFSRGLVFPIDDTYIHLAVARTLAETGTWAIDPARGFSSPSSSPGWVALLALTFLFTGPTVWAPVLLNAALSVGFTVRVARHLTDNGLPALISAALTVAVAIATPLPSMTTLGMEHVLHAWLVFELVVALGRWNDGGSSSGALWLAAFATLVRYETVFVVVPALVYLLGQRRFAHAGRLAVATVSLVVVFGVYSLVHGGWFVPTSLLVKVGVGSHAGRIAENLQNPGLVVPMLLAGGLAIRTGRKDLSLFAAAALLQLLLARTGWAYRYEAWCVAVGLALTIPWVWREAGSRAVRIAVLAATLAILIPRAWTSIGLTPAGSRDVFTVWVAPARVIAALPAGPVAANALGALAWENPGRPILDLDGLDSAEIATLWLTDAWTSEALEAAATHADVQVVFVSEGWFRTAGLEGPPPSWLPVATWEVRAHYTGATLRSRFYATSAGAAGALQGALSRPRATLPLEVTWRPDLATDPVITR